MRTRLCSKHFGGGPKVFTKEARGAAIASSNTFTVQNCSDRQRSKAGGPAPSNPGANNSHLFALCGFWIFVRDQRFWFRNKVDENASCRQKNRVVPVQRHWGLLAQQLVENRTSNTQPLHSTPSFCNISPNTKLDTRTDHFWVHFQVTIQHKFSNS